MSRRPRDFVDEALLREVHERPFEAGIRAAEAAVESWGFAQHGGAHHRTWVFQPHEGPVTSKLMRGLPDRDVQPRELYGFDSEDHIVLARAMDGARVVEQTAIRHEGDVRTGVTYMRDPEGRWAPEIAFYERRAAGRLIESGLYGVHVGSVGHEYRYDALGERVVEVIERRSERFADGSFERRLHMQYGVDGNAEVLTENGSVVWRRRNGAKQRRAALEAVEECLLADLRAAIRVVSLEGPPTVVMLRHQDDGGGWVDQALPDVSAHRELVARDSRGRWENAWSAEDWDVPSVSVRFGAATLRALDELEATGTPVEGEARILLRTVAGRLRAMPPLSECEAVVVVSGHDPDDLRHDVLRSISSVQRERLASPGWL